MEWIPGEKMTAGFSNPSNNAGSEENGLPRVKSQKPFWLTKNEGNIGTGGRQAGKAVSVWESRPLNAFENIQ